MMKNSNFEKIYLQIIKEQFDPSLSDSSNVVSIVVDVCTDYMSIDEFIASAKAAGIEAVVITMNGPGAGWPQVELTGEEPALRAFYDEHFEGGESFDFMLEQDDECDEQAEDECDEQDDEQDDECDEQAVAGSEWIEDGNCLKCGSSECDGTCVCPKCGDMNCIGNCDGLELSSNPECESVKFIPRQHGKLISETNGCNKPKKEAKKLAKKGKKCTGKKCKR